MIQISEIVLILYCLFSIGVGFNLGLFLCLEKLRRKNRRILDLEKKLAQQRENIIMPVEQFDKVDQNRDMILGSSFKLPVGLEKGFAINIGKVQCLICKVQGVYDETWVIYDDEYPHSYMCKGCYDECHTARTEEEIQRLMEEDNAREEKDKY